MIAQAAVVDDAGIFTAMSDYRAYAAAELVDGKRCVELLRAATRRGDLPGARTLHERSLTPWRHITPIVDLDTRPDTAASTDGAAFAGWAEVEVALDAGYPRAAAAAAAGLAASVGAVELADAAPVDVVVGSAELLEEVAADITTADPAAAQAGVDGARAMVTEFGPLVAEADPALHDRIQAGFARVDEAMPCDEAGCTDTLKARLAGLSEDVSLMAGTLNLTP